MTSVAAAAGCPPWFAIASARIASRSSRRRATSASEIRSPGATSRFSRSHAWAFSGVPMRSHSRGKSWLWELMKRCSSSSRPGALGRPPGSICSPTRRLSCSSMPLSDQHKANAGRGRCPWDDLRDGRRDRGRPLAHRSGSACRSRLGARALLLRAGRRVRRDRRGARRPRPGRPLPGRARSGDRAERARVRRVPARATSGAEAAEVARWLAFLYGAVHGNMAAANGWMARAERLLEGVEESVEHGWLALDRAPWIDDPGERERCAMAALAIAQAVRRPRPRVRRAGSAGPRVRRHRTRRGGMTLLDEAMAAVSGGEVVARRLDRRDLLPAAERLRARDRREARGAVDGRGAAGSSPGATSCRRPAGSTTAGSSSRSAAGRRRRRSCSAAARVFEGGFAPCVPPRWSSSPRCACGRDASRRRSACSRGTSRAPRRTAGRWRRSRSRGAISRWPRTWRGCAWSARIRPIPPARRCSSCSRTSSWLATTFRPRQGALERLTSLAAISGDERAAATAQLDDGTRARGREGRARACRICTPPWSLRARSTCRYEAARAQLALAGRSRRRLRPGRRPRRGRARRRSSASARRATPMPRPSCSGRSARPAGGPGRSATGR